jgi:novel protein kinase C epsilon type
MWFTDRGTCLQEHVLFVMEYVSGGNMAEELKKVQVFSEERTRFYAVEITPALEFLHRYGILHR